MMPFPLNLARGALFDAFFVIALNDAMHIDARCMDLVPVQLSGFDQFLNLCDANLAAVPLMKESTYLFVQYHEFDLYYEVLPKFILTGYYGIENARGGRNTDWDSDTNKPRDQLGTGIGAGFDWKWAENSGLYFRHRWMQFEDRSFSLDKFKGREYTIEIKAFF